MNVRWPSDRLSSVTVNGPFPAIARFAAQVNQRSDDIGARRLHTVMEKLLEDVSFEAPDRPASTLVIDEAFVRERLEDLVQDEDLARFIL